MRLQRHRHVGLHAGRDALGGATGVDVAHEEGELVPAQAGGDVVPPQAAPQAPATRDSTSSPAAWPRESLTCLKPLRSTNSTAVPRPSESVTRSATSSWRSSVARFGRLVRESEEAASTARTVSAWLRAMLACSAKARRTVAPTGSSGPLSRVSRTRAPTLRPLMWTAAAAGTSSSPTATPKPPRAFAAASASAGSRTGFADGGDDAHLHLRARVGQDEGDGAAVHELGGAGGDLDEQLRQGPAAGDGALEADGRGEHLLALAQGLLQLRALGGALRTLLAVPALALAAVAAQDDEAEGAPDEPDGGETLLGVALLVRAPDDEVDAGQAGDLHDARAHAAEAGDGEGAAAVAHDAGEPAFGQEPLPQPHTAVDVGALADRDDVGVDEVGDQTGRPAQDVALAGPGRQLREHVLEQPGGVLDLVGGESGEVHLPCVGGTPVMLRFAARTHPFEGQRPAEVPGQVPAPGDEHVVQPLPAGQVAQLGGQLVGGARWGRRLGVRAPRRAGPPRGGRP